MRSRIQKGTTIVKESNKDCVCCSFPSTALSTPVGIIYTWSSSDFAFYWRVSLLLAALFSSQQAVYHDFSSTFNLPWHPAKTQLWSRERERAQMWAAVQISLKAEQGKPRWLAKWFQGLPKWHSIAFFVACHLQVNAGLWLTWPLATDQDKQTNKPNKNSPMSSSRVLPAEGIQSIFIQEVVIPLGELHVDGKPAVWHADISSLLLGLTRTDRCWFCRFKMIYSNDGNVRL